MCVLLYLNSEENNQDKILYHWQISGVIKSNKFFTPLSWANNTIQSKPTYIYTFHQVSRTTNLMPLCSTFQVLPKQRYL